MRGSKEEKHVPEKEGEERLRSFIKEKSTARKKGNCSEKTKLNFCRGKGRAKSLEGIKRRDKKEEKKTPAAKLRGF